MRLTRPIQLDETEDEDDDEDSNATESEPEDETEDGDEDAKYNKDFEEAMQPFVDLKISEMSEYFVERQGKMIARLYFLLDNSRNRFSTSYLILSILVGDNSRTRFSRGGGLTTRFGFYPGRKGLKLGEL
eukprot:g40979.t1